MTADRTVSDNQKLTVTVTDNNRRAALVEKVCLAWGSPEHDELARMRATAAIDLIRAEVLEEAAKWCEANTMGVGHRSIANKFAGYIADEFPEGTEGRHQGMGYAAAIRALKETREVTS